MSSELKEETEIVKMLKGKIGEDILEVKIPRPRRIFVQVGKNAFRKVIRYVTGSMGFTHLSTITGVDVGEEIEVIYHLNSDGGTELSLKVGILKDKPSLPTITDFIPGATLYEREVHDLLGVTFKGHPDLSPLVLPEGWPPNVYPLRKEWTIEKIRERIMKGGKQ
ncbi:MAG: NADH-quinone oxidoreductase subunit C [Candidatus Hodarchaeota archaeon]